MLGSNSGGRVTVVAAASLLMVLAPSARAYRPFNGTDAGVAELHKVEVELGPIEYLRVGDERQLAIPSVVVNYGAGSGYEFGVEGRRLMSMSPDPPVPQFDDVAVSAKRVLKKGQLQDRRGFSVATEAELLFPTHDAQHVGFQDAVVLSQVWDDLAVHVNGALARTREQETGRFASLIAVGPARWAYRPLAELTLEREGSARADRGLLVGMLWQTRDRLVMDFGFRIAYADERTAEVRAGLNFNKHVPHGPRMP